MMDAFKRCFQINLRRCIAARENVAGYQLCSARITMVGRCRLNPIETRVETAGVSD